MRTKGEYKFFRFTDDFISECEYEVKDLIENQEYEFRIIAENKQGQSLPSEPCRTFKAKDNIPGVPPEVTLGPEFGNLIGTQGKIQATATIDDSTSRTKAFVPGIENEGSGSYVGSCTGKPGGGRRDKCTSLGKSSQPMHRKTNCKRGQGYG
jgi:hypothetical protein